MKQDYYLNASYAKSLGAIHRWMAGRPGGPLRVEFYPTNRCNIQCQICWQRTGEYDKTYMTEMSDERCMRLVDEVSYYGKDTYWIIKGGGEPMARGKLVMQMVRRIRELGMSGQLYTNGTLFKPEQLQEFAELTWDSINISLDVPSREINDEIRTGGFDKVSRNLNLLQEYKKEAASEYPTVTLTTVVTNRIVDRLEEVFKFAHDHGISKVYFSGLIRFTEKCDPFMLNSLETGRLRENAQRAMAYAEEMCIAHNLDELIAPDLWSSPNDRKYKGESPKGLGVAKSFCFKPYTELTIFPDGTTGPCCMSHDENGWNLKDKTFREVWEQGYMARVRDHFEHNRPMSYCAQCPTTLYTENMILREMLRESRPLNAQYLRGAVAEGMRSVREKGVALTVRRCGTWVVSTWRLLRS